MAVLTEGFDYSYLEKHPKKEIAGLNQPIRVIHEGLTNRPDLKKKLGDIIANLQNVSDNTTSHLSDVAYGIQFMAIELRDLAKETFEAHEIEKSY